MSFMKTNNVNITVGGTTYNSLDDYGLAIENTDYLGDPVQAENLTFVPGRSGPLDFTDSVFGGPYYQYREIKIAFGKLTDSEDWDSWISAFRDKFEGRVCTLEFATDPGWFYKGRVSIRKFAHKRALGTFQFCIPFADPYKYRDIDSTFNSTALGVTKSYPINGEKVLPTIVIDTSASVTVTLRNTTKTLTSGTYKDPDFVLLPDTDNEFLFVGVSTNNIKFRERRL